MDVGIVSHKPLDDLPRLIGASVVYEYDLIAETVVVHHAFNPGPEFGQAFGLVVERNDH